MLNKINWLSLFNHSGRYVVANVAVSALGFLRNIIFMKTMGHGDLGQVAMLQTIVIVVGFLQLGLINGGYRLYASADANTSRAINNNVLTSVFLIACLVIPGTIFFGILERGTIFNIGNQTLFIGVIAGIATLASTWINNALIAKGRLGLSSAINLIAATISLSVALFPTQLDLVIALVAILIQPVIVTLLAFLYTPGSWPSLTLEREVLRNIFQLGFPPFCAGILTLVNFQIERWFLVSHLGADALGIYYITIVYSTIFSLVPASLMNLFYPRAVQAYEISDKYLFSSVARAHLFLLSAYIVSASLITIILLTSALNNYLTSYKGREVLVFISIPGLIALTLFDNVALVFQSARKMLSLLLFALISLVLNIVAFSLAVRWNALTLELSAAIKSSSYIIAAAIIASHLFIRRKKILIDIDFSAEPTSSK